MASVEKVRIKLIEALDQKVMKGGRARAALEEAERACRGTPPPWPQLVAYRHAHLTLREGELAQADDLFERAGDGGFLGGLPALYRAAVAARRGDGPEAKVQIRRALEAEAAHNAPGERPAPFARPLQSRFPDLVELACYFTGADPGDTIGLADLRAILEEGSDAFEVWAPYCGGVRMREELAAATLDGCRDEAVVQVWRDGGVSHIRVGDGPYERVGRSDNLLPRLFSALAKEDRIRSEAVWDDPPTEQAIQQKVRRANDWLKERGIREELAGLRRAGTYIHKPRGLRVCSAVRDGV